MLNRFSQGARLTAIVRGTILPTAEDPRTFIAETTATVVLPPKDEILVYDGAGRLTRDACWNYSWDGPGRLKSMSRTSNTLSEPTLSSEDVEFTYDADGRRTRKLITRYSHNYTVVARAGDAL